MSSNSKNDNIIDQLKRKNKNAVIFGDDTWTKLFKFE